MNVSITPELEKFVKELVQTGRYHSASEVFRNGLRLLEQAERRRLLEKAILEGLTPEEEAQLPAELLDQARAEIRTKIQEGLDSLDRGDVVDGEEFFSRWRKRIADEAASAKGTEIKRRA